MQRVRDFFYTVKLIEIDSINKTEILNPNEMIWRPLFYCDNIPGLIDFVLKVGGYLHNTELFLKVGLDHGGSFLKVCLNFEKAQSELKSPVKNGQSYSQGSQKFKILGVKKLIPLLFIQDAKKVMKI